MRDVSTALTVLSAIVCIACSSSDGSDDGPQGFPSGGSSGSGNTGGSLAGAPLAAGSTAVAGAGGSGGSGIPVTPPTAAGAAGEKSCGVQEFARQRKPPEVLLVLDRSGSMKDIPKGGMLTKWELTVPAAKSVVQSSNAGISWGLKLYPELDETDSCAPESIVPTIHVPIAADNAMPVVAAIDAATPEGDGTPTGDAIRFATDHLNARKMMNDNPKFILLATDGDPSCPSGGDAALEYAVENIEAALAAGFPTFVIGVDTTAQGSIQRLNAMAEAGGRPRPAPAPQRFYLTSTQATLEEALKTITGEVASCIFDLTPPPPVPDNIAVDFAGVRTDRDPTRQNGWEYVDDTHTKLEVYGSWCQRIQTEAMNQVQIKYGCPNVVIPPPR